MTLLAKLVTIKSATHMWIFIVNTKMASQISELASHFPHAETMIPYYSIGRVLLPGFERSGLVVPLDGEYVVDLPLNREPYGWLLTKLDSARDRFSAMAQIIREHSSIEGIADQDIDGRSPYLPNNYFGFGDAMALTAILATHKPRRYVEIGSGNSTRFARRAINRYSLSTEIICIDPNPRAALEGVADRIISQSVVSLKENDFADLEANDILMIDGSHLVFHGTDTTHLFLRILPTLRPGVLIHVHDIFLPYEYPQRLDLNFWNEQYLLGMLLMHKPIDDVIAPIRYMYEAGMVEEGASFWFKS